VNFKGIERRIQKLVAASSEVSAATTQRKSCAIGRATGEFSCPDGSRVPIAVYRQIIAAKSGSTLADLHPTRAIRE
jgi:hypothetical protein